MATEGSGGPADIPASVEQPVATISDVVAEVWGIREKVISDRKSGVLPEDWMDLASNEEYINEVFKAHPELGGGYPILIREAVQNERFMKRTVKKYLKWVSNTPDPKQHPDDNAFMRTQAEYYYFEELQNGKGRGAARKFADASYDELVSAEDDQRKFVDKRLTEYYKRVHGAKKRVAERLRELGALIVTASPDSIAKEAAEAAEAAVGVEACADEGAAVGVEVDEDAADSTESGEGDFEVITSKDAV